MVSKSKHYLTDEQLEYFRGKLLHWKEELLKESQDVQQLLKTQESEPDLIDSACSLANQTIELRTKDRSRKLIHKIDMALERIDNGTYGYCEETGEPIGIKRLEEDKVINKGDTIVIAGGNKMRPLDKQSEVIGGVMII